VEEDLEDLQEVPTSPVRSIRTTPPASKEESRLLAILNQLKEQNYFQRLGLKQSATSAEASKAFIKAARTYHPDQVSPEASELVKKLFSDIFSLLNEAHQKLADDRSRKQYLEALESGHSSEQVDVSNIIQAEAFFQKGQIFLNTRKYSEALKFFDQAIQLQSDEGEFQIYRGYALFMSKPDGDRNFKSQCEQVILNGLQMRGNTVSNGFLFLGRIYMGMNDMEKAKKMFQKTLSLEKNNVEAARELRLMNLRTEKKGGFKKK